MGSTPRAKSVPMMVDEFIRWSAGRADQRYQLVDGEVRAMSPAGTTHGTIQSNIARILGNHLAVPGSRCRVVTEPAIATRVRARHNLRVPDLGVTCTPDTATTVALPDPILLVEIISPGNAGETWDNIWAYASIPSVREILIVQSTRIEAQLLRRQTDGSWPAEPASIEQGMAFSLASIGFDGLLAALYQQTHLAAG